MKEQGIDIDWAKEFRGAITVCNKQGIILYMNDCSIQQFENYGGDKLIGTNLLDCHPEPSKTKLKQMLKEPVDNMYTIEKDKVKKIIYQTPWQKNGRFAGIVELSFEIDAYMPHFKRI